MYRSAATVVLLLMCSLGVLAQVPADPAARYHGVIALVHLQGGGSKENPRRPEYVPAPSREGILSWSTQLSDDGKMALVQYVAVERKALEPILNDKRGDVKVFEAGRAKKDDIEKELRKFRKDFDLSQFEVAAR